MPILSVAIDFELYRSDDCEFTTNQLLVMLKGLQGEVESIENDNQQSGRAKFCIASKASSVGIMDAEFELWSEQVFDKVIHFLGHPSINVLASQKKVNSGMWVWLRIIYYGEFPIIDFPHEISSICMRLHINFFSNWELIE